MRDLFPEDPSLQVFAHRFEYENALQKRFDPTAVRVIVSPASQMREPPGGVVVPSIEVAGGGGIGYLNPPGVLGTSSPKRPFGADGSLDGPARKIARGESPLKGAAGRRMANTSRSGGTPLQTVATMANASGHWVVPQHVNFLLSVLPNARHTASLTPQLDPLALVNVMRGVNLQQPNVWASANLRTAGQGLMDPRYHQPAPTPQIPPIPMPGGPHGLPPPPIQQMQGGRPPIPIPPMGIPMPGQYGAPPPPQFSAPPPQQGGYYPPPLHQHQPQQPPSSQGFGGYGTPVNGMYSFQYTLGSGMQGRMPRQKR